MVPLTPGPETTATACAYVAPVVEVVDMGMVDDDELGGVDDDELGGVDDDEGARYDNNFTQP